MLEKVKKSRMHAWRSGYGILLELVKYQARIFSQITIVVP